MGEATQMLSNAEMVEFKDYVAFCRLVLAMQKAGANVRAIAKFFGMSKSKLYRDLPMIAHVAKLSQMGQAETENAGFLGAALSQMGQLARNGDASKSPSSDEGTITT